MAQVGRRQLVVERGHIERRSRRPLLCLLDLSRHRGDRRGKKEIAAYVARITDHIIDHGFYYVGPPGVPTTWGVWAPEKLNHDLKRLGDRGLNSLEILSHLKVADHIVVGNPRYAEAAKELIEKHAYATNTVLQKHTWPLEMTNHSDDELAFTAYYPLVIYERNPDLHAKYMLSLKRTWMVERPEHSPFFNFIYAAGVQANSWTDPSKRPDPGMIAPRNMTGTIASSGFAMCRRTRRIGRSKTAIAATS